MKILILSGKQGSGKTTLQNLVMQYLRSYDWKIHLVNFADELYWIHNMARERLTELGFPPPKEVEKKDGPLLQFLGTDWARKTYGDNIWADVLKNKVGMVEVGTENTLVIVGDCRFENEFDAFPNALRVRLEASEEVRKSRCSMWRDNTNHPSEIGLDNYAAQGKFDLYIDTEKYESHHGLALVIDQLRRNCWMEKRNV